MRSTRNQNKTVLSKNTDPADYRKGEDKKGNTFMLGDRVDKLNSAVEELGRSLFTLNDKLVTLQSDSNLLALGEIKGEEGMSSLVYDIHSITARIIYLTDIANTIIRRTQI